MDILLLSITVVSLVIAFVASLAAWRFAREERARSAARIAALAAAANGEFSAGDTLVNEPMSIPAVAPLWNAPVAPPRGPRPDEFPEERPSRHEWATSPTLPSRTTDDIGEAFLGSAIAPPSSGGRQRGLAVAAGVLFVAIVTGGYLTLFGDDRPATTSSSSPLELVSLRHERQDGGGLAITGLVRNPAAGRVVEKLAAVVLLFDQHGSFLATSKAGVDYTQLTPGDESPFVVRVQAPKNVARYRVSFRTDDGVVPHVDRRGQEPIARDLP